MKQKQAHKKENKLMVVRGDSRWVPGRKRGGLSITGGQSRSQSQGREAQQREQSQRQHNTCVWW